MHFFFVSILGAGQRQKCGLENSTSGKLNIMFQQIDWFNEVLFTRHHSSHQEYNENMAYPIPFLWLFRWLSDKEYTFQCRKHEFHPWVGKGSGSPVQYSCLGNPMDRGAQQAIVCRIIRESDTIQQLISNNNIPFLLFLYRESVQHTTADGHGLGL